MRGTRADDDVAQYGRKTGRRLIESGHFLRHHTAVEEDPRVPRDLPLAKYKYKYPPTASDLMRDEAAAGEQ
jgi:hypothetical protein